MTLDGCREQDYPPIEETSGESAAVSQGASQPLYEERQEVQKLLEEALPYVQTLAVEQVEKLGFPGLRGEEIVHAAYRYLVEQVYFADPVGLDLWRYLSDEQGPIPYIENRALCPLLLQIGSCEDFAAAMVLLLRAAGLEAEYVAGFTISVEGPYIDHAWAVVRLDGQWYHLDPQLEQNVTRDNALTYRYYLKSDEVFDIDHKWGEGLIAYWPEMPEEEQEAIRSLYTPPECPVSYPARETERIPLPLRPNMAEVEAQMRRIVEESGKGEEDLPAMRLNVEPPILVAEHHITPPLLPGQPAEEVERQRYGRSLLEGEAGALYDAMEEAAGNGAAIIPIAAGFSEARAALVANTFLEDHPEYFWLQVEPGEENGRRVLRLEPMESYEQKQRAVQKITAEILAAVRGVSEWETALYLHDYLAGSIAYVSDTVGRHSGDIYGGLVEKTAYCDGFARSYQYLCQQAGLETAYIRGTSNRGIAHGWNAVRLEGRWHYVDVTWDRPMQPGDGVYHDYFLLSMEEMHRERSWDATQYPALPTQGGGDPGYYGWKGYAVEADSREDAVEALALAFFRQLPPMGRFSTEPAPVFLEIKVLGGSEEYMWWKDQFVREIFSVLRRMDALAKEENLPVTVLSDTSVQCNFNDTMQILTFYPKLQQTEE